MKPRRTVAIAGLGLVGGSLARALTAAGWRVLGVDSPAIVERAMRAGAIVASRGKVEAAAREAFIVVLAAPPAVNLRLLRRLARAGAGAVITDVSSVKGPICLEAKRLGLKTFVGGHPMAGNEGSGFGASSADLFRGKAWVLTGGESAALRAVKSLVVAVGGKPCAASPSHHDRAVAFLSHVPQIVSWGILAGALKDPVAREHLFIAGPGFRDMTRLASSPRRLWRQILEQNGAEIERAKAALLRWLEKVPKAP